MSRSSPPAKPWLWMYAIRSPSGDQADSMSKPSPSVSRVTTPPDLGILQMAPWYETTTRMADVPGSRRLAPSHPVLNRLHGMMIFFQIPHE
jgi:hypothetical protein